LVFPFNWFGELRKPRVFRKLFFPPFAGFLKPERGKGNNFSGVGWSGQGGIWGFGIKLAVLYKGNGLGAFKVSSGTGVPSGGIKGPVV